MPVESLLKRIEALEAEVECLKEGNQEALYLADELRWECMGGRTEWMAKSIFEAFKKLHRALKKT